MISTHSRTTIKYKKETEKEKPKYTYFNCADVSASINRVKFLRVTNWHKDFSMQKIS